MKLKKMSLSIVLIMTALSLLILPATAPAATYDCASCKITRLGMYPGKFGTTDGFMVQVDDAADKWTGSMTFYLNDTLGKAGWATVLTAYSLGKTLWLRVVDTTPGSLITVVHIND
jgi:hypothetical protein